MQIVSSLYNSIVASEHWFDTKVVFALDTDDLTLSEGEIISISRTQALFAENRPMVGCACCGECELTVFKPAQEFPRMGRFSLFVRAVDGERQSEWIPQGVYFIDTRETGNLDGLQTITVHGYDAMAKASQEYPSTTHAWPASTLTVISDIASAMGVRLDPRTSAQLRLSPYSIPLPAGYSCTEVLKNIAAMYMANWYITADGKLRMVGINELPQETRYLIDNSGNSITFGGVRILV